MLTLGLLLGFILFTWLLAALNVAGIWLGCIPSPSEYDPCPSKAVAWTETLGSIVAPALLTLLVCAIARRVRRLLSKDC